MIIKREKAEHVAPHVQKRNSRLMLQVLLNPQKPFQTKFVIFTVNTNCEFSVESEI